MITRISTVRILIQREAIKMTQKRVSGERTLGGSGNKMSLALLFLVAWNAGSTQGIQIDNQLVSSPNGKKSVEGLMQLLY